MSILSKISKAWRLRADLPTFIRNSRPFFSQYGEDAIFARLLKPGPVGTYVDVGANHPITGSNTFALYLRGWNGVAIDPNPQFAGGFRKYRSRDIYLTAGVSLKPETLTYHAFEEHVFNTFDTEVAGRLIAQGRKMLSITSVPCRPLADIVEQYLGRRHIDFLNVDCEGLDIDVLESLDLTRRRPTVIVVEDYPRYFTFQRHLPVMRLERFLRENHYLPLAQMAWSGLYIAEDWERLFKLSDAFDEKRLRNGYLPGQASAEAIGRYCDPAADH